MADGRYAVMQSDGFSHLFEIILYNMSHDNPGIILKSLIVSLCQFEADTQRWHEAGLMENCSYFKVMCIIEIIVHYSMVMTYDPECLADISLYEIKQCQKFVAEIRSNVQHLSYFKDHIANRCLAVLEDMKRLSPNVSIHLPLFSIISVNVIYIAHIDILRVLYSQILILVLHISEIFT